MTTGKQDDTKGTDAMPVGIASTDQLGLAAEALRRAYYYTELGGWRGPEVDEDERWIAVAQAAQDVGRSKAFQDAARWVDEEMGHAIQDGWSVEAVQALMATRDMLKAHADMQATTVEVKA